MCVALAGPDDAFHEHNIAVQPRFAGGDDSVGRFRPGVEGVAVQTLVFALGAMLVGLAPDTRTYRHDDFSVRTVNMTPGERRKQDPVAFQNRDVGHLVADGRASVRRASAARGRYGADARPIVPLFSI